MAGLTPTPVVEIHLVIGAVEGELYGLDRRSVNVFVYSTAISATQ